jgi:REP element-mobilizing transposase RayT
MANTYTQIHIHLVFAVKYRNGLISKAWQDELYQYITGIIRNNKHKLLIINGMPDHIHLLIGLRPDQSLSELVKSIKQMSSLWINERRLVQGKFAWQEGFGAFSYSHSQLPQVIEYIERQEEHHRKRTFAEEYKEFLRLFAIDFEDAYIFKPLE